MGYGLMKVVILAIMLVSMPVGARDFWAGDADKTDGKPGIMWEHGTSMVPHILDTDIRVKNTPEKAAKELQSMFRPETEGVNCIHIPTGFETKSSHWWEMAQYIGIYGDEGDIFECYADGLRPGYVDEMSTNNCYLNIPTNVSGYPERIDGPGAAAQLCGIEKKYQEPRYYLPQETDQWVSVKKLHDTLYICEGPRFSCFQGNPETGAVTSELHLGGHIYCPPGDVPQWDSYNNPSCVEDDFHLGTIVLKLPSPDTCTAGKETQPGRLEIKASYKPQCDGSDCPKKNMYLFVDWAGGADGQWDSQGKVLGRYNEATGRKEWATEVSKESFHGAEVDGPVHFMWMFGNGRILNSGCMTF